MHLEFNLKNNEFCKGTLTPFSFLEEGDTPYLVWGFVVFITHFFPSLFFLIELNKLDFIFLEFVFSKHSLFFVWLLVSLLSCLLLKNWGIVGVQYYIIFRCTPQSFTIFKGNTPLMLLPVVIPIEIFVRCFEIVLLCYKT